MSEVLIRRRYRLVRLVGEGGMGKVWEAYDTEKNAVVAIKQFRSELMREGNLLKRFEREAQLMRELNHPHILNALAFFEDQGDHYLVMPFMTGSLYELLKLQGAMPVEWVRDIGISMADALAGAHEIGIIHRDLKPENILINTQGQPVLTDFGLARMKFGQVLTQEGAIIGSISHMSPEVCRGHRADERADVWGLGALFYELLTGNAPFQHDDVRYMVRAIISKPPAPIENVRSDVPSQMLKLIDDMLAKNPENRTGSMQEVIDRLTEVPDVSSPPKRWPPAYLVKEAPPVELEPEPSSEVPSEIEPEKQATTNRILGGLRRFYRRLVGSTREER